MPKDFGFSVLVFIAVCGFFFLVSGFRFSSEVTCGFSVLLCDVVFGFSYFVLLAVFGFDRIFMRFCNLVPRAFLRRGEYGREKSLASADHVIFKHPEKLDVIN